MPGTIWNVSCDACGETWEAEAGAGPGAEFLPATCAISGAVVTGISEDGGAWLCEDCDAVCEPLPGAVIESGRELPEQVDVACPACGSGPLRAFVGGAWD